MISFTPDAWKHYVYWQSQDRKSLNRINKLINDVRRSPFSGIGKPEPLKAEYSGYWSRRIDEKNRFVYRVSPDEIVIIQCRYHYGDKS